MAFMLFWGILFLALIPLVYRRFGPVYALFTACTVLLPLSSSLPGLERYVLVAFPVFAAIGAARTKKALVLLIAGSFWVEMLATAMFARGYGLF